jgi:hypothetical protein
VCVFFRAWVCVRLYYSFFEGRLLYKGISFVPQLLYYVHTHTHVDHTSLCVCLLPNLLLIKSTRSIVCVCGWITHQCLHSVDLVAWLKLEFSFSVFVSCVCVCLPLVSTLKHKNRYGRWRGRGCCTSQQSRTPGGVSPLDRTGTGQMSSKKAGGNLQNRYHVEIMQLFWHEFLTFGCYV